MKNYPLRVLYAIFMVAVTIAIAVFMVIHICAGVEGQNAKFILAGYVLLLIWALSRCYTLIRNLRNRN
jgi:hypothetical protein